MKTNMQTSFLIDIEAYVRELIEDQMDRKIEYPSVSEKNFSESKEANMPFKGRNTTEFEKASSGQNK